MQGAGEKLRWALAGVGTVYGVISSLVPEADMEVLDASMVCQAARASSVLATRVRKTSRAT
jgi:hypothetical protein